MTPVIKGGIALGSAAVVAVVGWGGWRVYKKRKHAKGSTDAYAAGGRDAMIKYIVSNEVANVECAAKIADLFEASQKAGVKNPAKLAIAHAA